MKNEVPNSFSVNNFFETNNIFIGKREKLFQKAATIFEGNGASDDKNECITFFTGNKVPNIFSVNIFFWKNQYFPRKPRNRGFTDMAIFERKRGYYTIKIIN